MPPTPPLVAAAAVGRLLRAAGQKVAVAESSAGGLIAARLLAVPGASKFFESGVVCYTSASKRNLLSIRKDAARSATTQHALELADGARLTLGADWGIGETGVAGPSANSRGVVGPPPLCRHHCASLSAVREPYVILTSVWQPALSSQQQP